ncbi:hypothetical protein ACFL7M_14010, partial [Thermodesulfobacteriota bacterium]
IFGHCTAQWNFQKDIAFQGQILHTLMLHPFGLRLAYVSERMDVMQHPLPKAGSTIGANSLQREKGADLILLIISSFSFGYCILR